MINIQFLQGTFRLSCDGIRIPLQPNALLALYCSGGPVESRRLVDLLWGYANAGIPCDTAHPHPAHPDEDRHHRRPP